MAADAPGPLAGLTVIELAGLGPAPFAARLLAGMGARVVRIERPGSERPFSLPPEHDIDRLGRELLTLDLKRPEAVSLLATLASRADVLVEGYRPGVMERLGLGPQSLIETNPRLVYARITGFRRDGPLAESAGHDLTYLALSGILSGIGEKGRKPVPPLNLIGDYGGGAMVLLAGILAALFERGRSGRGQVVDVAMVDGIASLAALPYALLAGGLWRDERGVNVLDGGAPFYDTYETADGKYVAVACLEPQFFAEFARLLPLPPELVAGQVDRAAWPALRQTIAARIKQRTRAEWETHFAGTDACVAPVLSLSEAAGRRAAEGRATPETPGFSRSRWQPTPAPSGPACDPAHILIGFGVGEAETKALAAKGIIVQ